MPPPSPDQAGLSLVGLSLAEQAAYEALIERPSATLYDLATTWSLDEPLAPLLSRLEERSLVTRLDGPPARFRAVSPAVAFAALFAEYEERLEQARRHVAILDAAYQARPTMSGTTSVVEVITGSRAVRQRWTQVRRGARHHINCLAKPPYLVDPANPSEAESDPAHPGLTCRTIYDHSAVEYPGALATIERSIRAGQLARVLPGLPISLYLADARIAFLPLQRHAAAQDATIVVHPSALLDGLITLFEGLWQRALPLHQPSPVPAQRDDAEGAGSNADRLITLLLSGLTDEAIARQLDLSQRTVQRRVAALMVDLGAHSRFQAGVRAALQQIRLPPG